MSVQAARLPSGVPPSLLDLGVRTGENAEQRDLDEPAVRIYSSGTKLYHHRNQQYSIVALTNGSGSIVEHHAYTAYGEPTILDGSLVVEGLFQEWRNNGTDATGDPYFITASWSERRKKTGSSVDGGWRP